MTGCQGSLFFRAVGMQKKWCGSKTFLQLQLGNSNTLQKKGAFLGIPEAIIHVECVSGVGPSGTFPGKTLAAKGRPQFASTTRKGYLQPLGRILISSTERSEDHSSQDTSLALLLLLLCSTTFTKSAPSPLKRVLYSIEELMVFWSQQKKIPNSSNLVQIEGEKALPEFCKNAEGSQSVRFPRNYASNLLFCEMDGHSILVFES